MALWCGQDTLREQHSRLCCDWALGLQGKAEQEAKSSGGYLTSLWTLGSRSHFNFSRPGSSFESRAEDKSP